MNRFFKIVLWVLGGIIVSIVTSVAYYCLFAWLFSSDVEKALEQENALYEKYLPQIEGQAYLMDAEMELLRRRDEHIYKSVFKADAPAVSEMIEADIQLDDITGRGDIIKKSYMQSERAAQRAARVEQFWREITDSISRKSYPVPPMITPVKELTHKNIASSTGDKLSPFYRTTVAHNGLDIIAPAGTPVIAACDGLVTAVQKSSGGMGNMVTVAHSGGYVTRYAHLSEITVPKGRRVKAGDVIGKVGDSGRAFTTHLHYEVLRYGEPQDPNNYFYGVISPEEYLKFMIKSASSGQSMD